MDELCRAGMPWTDWDERCCEKHGDVEAARLLRRTVGEVRRRKSRVRRCFHCQYWHDGWCDIAEAGLHAAGEPITGMKKHPITDRCDFGLGERK